MAASLKKIRADAKIKIIQADFTDNASVDFYKAQITSQLAPLDISLVVINAGLADISFFKNANPHRLQAMLDTNVYQYAMMLKLCLPMLVKRQSKSLKCGLIAVSSVISALPIPGWTGYASTKAFVNYLMVAVA